MKPTQISFAKVPPIVAQVSQVLSSTNLPGVFLGSSKRDSFRSFAARENDESVLKHDGVDGAPQGSILFTKRFETAEHSHKNPLFFTLLNFQGNSNVFWNFRN